MAKQLEEVIDFQTDDEGYVHCTCGANVLLVVAQSGYGTKHLQFWSCPECDDKLNELVAQEIEELPF